MKVVTNSLDGVQGFPTSTPYFTPAPPKLDRSDLLRELGTTGLWRFGGTVREEFLRDLQARKGIQIYREMRENHPVINAVFFAIEMSLRQVRWFVEPASQDDADKENAEFLESCLDDMSFTWQDTIAQIVTFLQYGFSLFELVYKVRKGEQSGDGADSQYDDGKIGWRKWLPLAQDTLAPGREWIWDQNGGVQGINQMAPPDWILRTLPIEKLLLFRTSVAKNNPEGRSILRGMYIPWYYAKNMMEIEGIAMERMSAGFPVVYLGDDTNKDPNNANSDLSLAKQIVRDVRSDEQSGVVIPYPKMGQGADAGKGMLFEFASSPSRGVMDFEAPIQRYNKQIAMTCLAEFIMLGMDGSGRGSYALSKNKSDMFVMALTSWAEMIVQVVNRFAVKRLFDLNNLDTTNMPRLTHSEVSVPDLAELGTYINQLVGAQVITPDANLEAVLREKAHLPPAAADVSLQVGESNDETMPDQESGQEAVDGGQNANPDQPTPNLPNKPTQPNAPNSGPNGALARNMPPRQQSGLATRQARMGAAPNRSPVPGASYSARAERFNGKRWTTLNGVEVVAVGNHRAQAKSVKPEAASEKLYSPAHSAFSPSDQFATLADSRRAVGGARYETATNEYQAQLENIYTDWYDGLAANLADESDDNKREEILLAALIVLEGQLKRAGRDGILAAMQLGAGDTPLTPDALSQLAQTVSENDAYIEGSLIPAIRNKAQGALRDSMLVMGGTVAISGVFSVFLGRVASYSGAVWKAIWMGLGDRLGQEDMPQRVQRVLDDGAQHCATCPAKAGIYDSFEQMQSAVGLPGDGSDQCHSNCRCTIRVEVSRRSGVFERF